MEVGPELKLRPRRTKLLVLTGVAAAFCAIGLLMIRDGDSRGWFCLGFFSLCAVIFLVQLVPGASYLKLDAQGLTVRSLFRSTSYTWSEIVAFAPGRVGGNPGVVFNLTPDSERQRRLRRFNATAFGAEAALPDTYGFPAERLAEILNEWKRGLRRLDV
jgi:hypothetical protein